ncbi:MAG TPA: ATP-binding protein [Armatimonadota bacterium]|nr:ATP-binding protein [Armatimonadota bacterium]
MAKEKLSLPANQASGRLLRTALAGMCDRFGVDREASDDFGLAVSEAFSNAVRHGDAARQATVSVLLEMSADLCRVTLLYAGEPFPLTEPQLPHDGSTNGRGRYLMSVLADAVDYQFRNGKTRVILSKRWLASGGRG